MQRKQNPSELLTILTGAGISVESPSNLPLAYPLRTLILKELVADLSQSTDLNMAIDTIDQSDFPLEFLLEVLYSRFGITALSCLYHLSSTTPNTNHYVIAKLATQRKLFAIITLNLDELIEYSFDIFGLRKNVDYRVIHGLPSLPLSTYPLPLIKLHGTISDSSSLIVTLQQVGHSKKFQQDTRLLFNKCSQNSKFLVSGYRGADPDLQIALHELLKTGHGEWNSRKADEIYKPIRELLQSQHQSWSIIEENASKFLSSHTTALKEKITSRSTNSSTASGSWAYNYDNSLKLKCVTDILSHIGAYNLVKSLTERELQTHPSNPLPTLFALIEGQLATANNTEARLTLDTIDRHFETQHLNTLTHISSQMIERILVLSKWLWQVGKRSESVSLLENARTKVEAGLAQATQHQKVRLLTYIAERIVQFGDSQRAIDLCNQANDIAADHIQLSAVARRTHGLCLLHAGNYDAAEEIVNNALPDLVADINGRIIALSILTKVALARKDMFLAEKLLRECWHLCGKTDHVVRSNEISQLEKQLNP